MIRVLQQTTIKLITLIIRRRTRQRAHSVLTQGNPSLEATLAATLLVTRGTCQFFHLTRFGARSLVNSPVVGFYRFRRAGITYGPELQPDEQQETIDDRGLVFICYQSSIVRGFKFVQQSNNFNDTIFFAIRCLTVYFYYLQVSAILTSRLPTLSNLGTTRSLDELASKTNPYTAI